jgi:hypothetical protein
MAVSGRDSGRDALGVLREALAEVMPGEGEGPPSRPPEALAFVDGVLGRCRDEFSEAELLRLARVGVWTFLTGARPYLRERKKVVRRRLKGGEEREYEYLEYVAVFARRRHGVSRELYLGVRGVGGEVPSVVRALEELFERWSRARSRGEPAAAPGLLGLALAARALDWLVEGGKYERALEVVREEVERFIRRVGSEAFKRRGPWEVVRIARSIVEGESGSEVPDVRGEVRRARVSIEVEGPVRLEVRGGDVPDRDRLVECLKAVLTVAYGAYDGAVGEAAERLAGEIAGVESEEVVLEVERVPSRGRLYTEELVVRVLGDGEEVLRVRAPTLEGLAERL